jgi:hypothetical protein
VSWVIFLIEDLISLVPLALLTLDTLLPGQIATVDFSLPFPPPSSPGGTTP